MSNNGSRKERKFAADKKRRTIELELMDVLELLYDKQERLYPDRAVRQHFDVACKETDLWIHDKIKSNPQDAHLWRECARTVARSIREAFLREWR